MSFPHATEDMDDVICISDDEAPKQPEIIEIPSSSDDSDDEPQISGFKRDDISNSEKHMAELEESGLVYIGFSTAGSTPRRDERSRGESSTSRFVSRK